MITKTWAWAGGLSSGVALVLLAALAVGAHLAAAPLTAATVLLGLLLAVVSLLGGCAVIAARAVVAARAERNAFRAGVATTVDRLAAALAELRQ